MSEKQPMNEKRALFSVGRSVSAGQRLPPRRSLQLVIITAILGVVVLATVIGYLQQWLWMGQLGYAGVFWTPLATKWAMFCSAFSFAFVYLWLNRSRSFHSELD